jgi:hypothetical protein
MTRLSFKQVNEEFDRIREIAPLYDLRLNDSRVGGCMIVELQKQGSSASKRQIFSGDLKECSAWIAGFMAHFYAIETRVKNEMKRREKERDKLKIELYVAIEEYPLVRFSQINKAMTELSIGIGTLKFVLGRDVENVES